MSRSALVVAGELYAALTRGDRAVVLGLLAEDVELLSLADLSGRASAQESLERGHAPVRRWWDGLDAEQRRAAVWVTQLQEIAGRVVCSLAVSTVAADGTREPAAWCWSVTSVDGDGLISALWNYRSHAQAIAAARTGNALQSSRASVASVVA